MLWGGRSKTEGEAARAGVGWGAGGVEGTRSLLAAADDARRDGAQPPRSSARVPRGPSDPSQPRRPNDADSNR